MHKGFRYGYLFYNGNSRRVKARMGHFDVLFHTEIYHFYLTLPAKLKRRHRYKCTTIVMPKAMAVVSLGWQLRHGPLLLLNSLVTPLIVIPTFRLIKNTFLMRATLIAGN